MIPAVGIAYYNPPDLLLQCIESLQHPVGALIVVNNGEMEPHALGNLVESAAARGDVRNIFITHPGKNLGCAGGWNNILQKVFLEERLDAVLICGNDIEWAADDLAIIEKTRAEFPQADFIFGNHSYSNFLINRSGWVKVGAFDENIEIAYLEDGDHWQRILRTGAKAIHAAGLRATHGGSQTIKSDPVIARISNCQHELNWEYYSRKWGCPPHSTGQEKFATPFNNPDHGLNEWELLGERLNRPHFWRRNPEGRQ